MKRQPMPPKVEERNGKRCPECGATYDYGVNSYGGTAWKVDDVPHDDPKDCIRSLRDRMQEVEDKLERHNF